MATVKADPLPRFIRLNNGAAGHVPGTDGRDTYTVEANVIYEWYDVIEAQRLCDKGHAAPVSELVAAQQVAAGNPPRKHPLLGRRG